MSVFQKSFNILKKGGTKAFIYRAINKILLIFFEYNTYFIVEKDLKEKIIPYPAKVDIQFSLLLPSELNLFCDNELHYDEKDIIRSYTWLEKGDKCFVGYINDQIPTYLWVNLKERLLSRNYSLPIGKNKAFIFKGFTIPAMRGLGLAPSALTYALIWLQNNGYSIAYSDVDKKNIPSIRTLQKVGFQIIGSYRVFRILKYEWIILSSRLRKTISDSFK